MSRNKKGGWANSRRGTPHNDLVTFSEQTISSQATVVSQRTQDWESQLDQYDDLVGEEGEQLKISPQQQKRIQGVLQLARKGKINPTNAFEVPVRVADPHLGEGKSLRFWKFASELLTASMGIYDKRVEHLFLGTHRMFDTLLRTPSQPSQKQSPKEPFQQLFQPSQVQEGELSGYELAGCHCEDPSKLNLRGAKVQVRNDPLFSKKLQAFDSDSLKSLFLNIFQTGSQLEITFFNEGKQRKSDSGYTQNSKSMGTGDFNENDSTGTVFSLGEKRSDFLEQEFCKLNLLAKTGECFTNITAFKQDNQRFGFEPQSQAVVVEPLDFALGKPETDDITQLTQFTQYSEDLPLNGSDQESVQAVSQGFASHYFLSPNFIPEEITPWDLQFRGLKLQRKLRVRRGRLGQRKKRQKKEEEEGGVNFLEGSLQKRKEVLKPKYDASKYSKFSSNQDRFLLPYQFDHTRFFQRQHIKLAAKHQENTFLEGPPQEQQTIEIESGHWQPNCQESEREQPMSSLGAPQSQGLTNVRELKELVANRVKGGGRVLLSELNLGLSGASALVIALHLANDLRVDLLGGQNQSDIELKTI